MRFSLCASFGCMSRWRSHSFRVAPMFPSPSSLFHSHS